MGGSRGRRCGGLFRTELGPPRARGSAVCLTIDILAAFARRASA